MNTLLNDPLFLTVPATAEQVILARNQVAAYSRQHSWDDDDVYALTLAVGEACNNAVNYGGRGYQDAVVWVSCTPVSADRLQVEIKNQGNGFHPDLAILTQMPEADDFATCGRGFALMQALVDDVEVVSDGVNTTVRLTKSKSAPQ